MSAVAEPTTTELGIKSGECSKPDLPSLINVSERAASEVKRIIAEQNASGTNEKLYLRVRVVGGGCSGFQHKLDLDPTVNEKLDDVFETHGINVVVDKRSALYLNGVNVDFHDDLNKRGFSVDNPHAKTKCGCGSSFSM
ncbi:MAG: iron-sulfur cluster assembly accessory protein [Gemmataceae bacterium]